LHRWVRFHDTLYAVYGAAGDDGRGIGGVTWPGAWGAPPESVVVSGGLGERA
jgi:hypothetical protein